LGYDTIAAWTRKLSTMQLNLAHVTRN